MTLDITTTKQLAELLLSNTSESNPEVSPENQRYVLYARKSTDEKGKQVMSLDDQIAECRNFAEKEGLYIKKIIQESESAKEPGIRPKFREMLDGLHRDEYDAVLAWHPDRLARNMKEAGEVIDLLDKEIIRSLKFPSFSFTNDTAGKMVLGMTFVIAKQYSDNLSDGVNRGNKNRIAEGKYINKAKHGYVKDKNQYLRTDGENFVLIKNAFQMRKANITLDEIAQYLTSEGLTRQSSHQSKRISPKIAKQQVSKILRDPIYAGVVMYGENIADLTEQYDFVPAVSVEDFCAINKYDSKSNFFKALKTQRGGGKNIKADLLVQMVSCAECGDTMTTGLTSKKTSKGKTNYFYYRCENDECGRRSKNTRAKVIIDFVKEYMRANPFSNPDAYEHYKEELKRVNKVKLKDMTAKISSKQMELTKCEGRLENTATLLSEETDKEMQAHFKGDLRAQKAKKKELELELTKLRDERKKKKDVEMTYQEFLELWQKMAKRLDTEDEMKVIDTLVKKVFSNFSVTSKKVESYVLSTPFDRYETLKVPFCGG